MGRLFGTREAILGAAILAACLLFAFLSPTFATPANITTILRNSTELFLVGLGMTLLLGVGAIDVSVGVAMGLAAILAGKMLEAGAPWYLVALAGPLAGAALGLLASLVVVVGRVPAIVGTLGLYGIYRAAIFLALGGSWLSGLPTGLTDVLAARPFGIPVALPLIALAYLAVFVAVRKTPFGPHLLAIGQSEPKARLAGVPVRRTACIAFLVSGLLCGLAAIFYIATYRNVAMTIGGTLALEAIAAVVLGGTSILGGRISLMGTALGVLLLRILQNGLLLIGVPSLWQPVVTGALILLVLGGEVASGRLALPRTTKTVEAVR
ncbi:AI-2 transport system permease protein [Aureimonas altamirensis DSM 21988]|uniref:Autoinducer 2 import system permease protein LsrC n=3 Tax=Aureimonas altamirensis TaxID=370622 RepID=A0A0P0YXK1_9HYPH|nr:inner-membrane translocator [Aureimonas altamirensis]SHI77277.1 AI-2 transport system permease protein [Aureimonas altamirensis DSM 21988]